MLKKLNLTDTVALTALTVGTVFTAHLYTRSPHYLFDARKHIATKVNKAFQNCLKNNSNTWIQESIDAGHDSPEKYKEGSAPNIKIYATAFLSPFFNPLGNPLEVTGFDTSYELSRNGFTTSYIKTYGDSPEWAGNFHSPPNLPTVDRCAQQSISYTNEKTQLFLENKL